MLEVCQTTTIAVNPDTNRLSSAAYDASGNMTSWGANGYEYDTANNMVTQGARWYFLYNFSGERIAIFSGTWADNWDEHQFMEQDLARIMTESGDISRGAATGWLLEQGISTGGCGPEWKPEEEPEWDYHFPSKPVPEQSETQLPPEAPGSGGGGNSLWSGFSNISGGGVSSVLVNGQWHGVNGGYCATCIF